MAFKGNLAAIVLGGPTTTSVDTFYIWVMRKYGKTESWTKPFKFGLNDFVHIFGCTRNGEILVKKHLARSQFKDKWITKVVEVVVCVCVSLGCEYLDERDLDIQHYIYQL